MMKHLIGAVSALCMLPAVAFAGPCGDPGVPKQSAVINIGAAATTVIVPAVTSARVYVCAFVGSLAGTTPSITLKYGTKVTNDCDTGAVSLTGTILPTSGVMISAGWGDDILVTPPSQQVCGTTVGSGSSFQGIMTYVQK